MNSGGYGKVDNLEYPKATRYRAPRSRRAAAGDIVSADVITTESRLDLLLETINILGQAAIKHNLLWL